jgi:hypothetical protein
MALSPEQIKAILAERDRVQQSINNGQAGWGYSLHKGQSFAGSQEVLNPDGVTHPRIRLVSVNDEAIAIEPQYAQAKELFKVTYLPKDNESIDDVILNQSFWIKPTNGDAFRVKPLTKQTVALGNGFWYLYFVRGQS